ncbi:patatin-like phospholipase family protein [Planctomicrobium piriforme]|uniref:Patatin-like phospholipase n=1 Tax=Planctomicrobium piriforme TaxID=1576369 RepID=A0A1I3SQR3_9PLAN|nr:patatin-like phospholipase family protein [Planctomicrobium piriforme]SFJ61108.1 Patatin-like phospholipase [Planctomicrobium piriforme]
MGRLSSRLRWPLITLQMFLQVCLNSCAMERALHTPPPNVPLVDLTREDSPSDIEQTRYVPDRTPDGKNLLVLSGGGMNGAYTAGYLIGWTESGERPQFDVVTGVSTGALIAPFAFLGSKYDDELKRNYTTITSDDIYRKRLPVSLLWSDSVADPAPLKRGIEADMTPELLEEIAEAHRAGRRLYVGTTNLQTKRLVVWDIGAIACGDKPDRVELVRQILLASCSVPGFFPPVGIKVDVDGKPYTEWHVDGGVTASPFLLPEMVGIDESEEHRPDSRQNQSVYVIISGKLEPTIRPLEHGWLRISTESLEGLLQSRFRDDLMRVYMVTKSAGARFHLTAVPQALELEASSLTFDRKCMEHLFAVGRTAAGSSDPWQFVPPLVDDAVHPQPRRGNDFKTLPPPVKTAASQSPIMR